MGGGLYQSLSSLTLLAGLVTAQTWSLSTVPVALLERVGIQDMDFNGFLNMSVATSIAKTLVNIPASVSFPKVKALNYRHNNVITLIVT